MTEADRSKNLGDLRGEVEEFGKMHLRLLENYVENEARRNFKPYIYRMKDLEIFPQTIVQTSMHGEAEEITINAMKFVNEYEEEFLLTDTGHVIQCPIGDQGTLIWDERCEIPSADYLSIYPHVFRTMAEIIEGEREKYKYAETEEIDNLHKAITDFLKADDTSGVGIDWLDEQ